MSHELEIVHVKTGDIMGYMKLPLRIDGNPTSGWVIQQIVESLAGYEALVACMELKDAMGWFHRMVFQTKHTARDMVIWKDIWDKLEIFEQTLSENEGCVVLLSK